MSKYKTFWIDFKIGPDSNCHQITDVSLNKLGHPYKNVIKVIERAALDEAVALLKKTLEHFEDPYTDPNPRIEIDDFLKGLGEG